jgi:hypothetical protein
VRARVCVCARALCLGLCAFVGVSACACRGAGGGRGEQREGEGGAGGTSSLASFSVALCALSLSAFACVVPESPLQAPQPDASTTAADKRKQANKQANKQTKKRGLASASERKLLRPLQSGSRCRCGRGEPRPWSTTLLRSARAVLAASAPARLCGSVMTFIAARASSSRTLQAWNGHSQCGTQHAPEACSMQRAACRAGPPPQADSRRAQTNKQTNERTNKQTSLG